MVIHEFDTHIICKEEANLRPSRRRYTNTANSMALLWIWERIHCRKQAVPHSDIKWTLLIKTYSLGFPDSHVKGWLSQISERKGIKQCQKKVVQKWKTCRWEGHDEIIQMHGGKRETTTHRPRVSLSPGQTGMLKCVIAEEIMSRLCAIKFHQHIR